MHVILPVLNFILLSYAIFAQEKYSVSIGVGSRGGEGGSRPPIDFWFNQEFGNQIWSEVKVKTIFVLVWVIVVTPPPPPPPNPNHLPTPSIPGIDPQPGPGTFRP